ncbi:hydroxyphenylacetyl-CoA thioesterase PaaI [Bartonella sp. LJL80]
MNEQEIADLSAKTMWAGDKATQNLGMELVSCAPGQAVLRMQITDVMTNGHDIAHGGFVFALADSAFAYASNSYGDVHVAAQCHIAYIRPTRKGDILTAEAREVSRTGRSGIYDVHITANGKAVAEFRGFSREIAKNFIGMPAGERA